jgi:very-short-patch-repair endonuclease
MAKNVIIPYHPKLWTFARYLRNNSTLSEILLWKQIKNKAFGVEFHRQVPMDEFIQVIRFDDHEVKNNMFSVLLEIQHKIEEIENSK